VQCVALVRDDFWMAATYFLDELEILLQQGENSAALDLFDLRHARKVLAAFGRSFGCLAEDPGRVTPEQEKFLDQALAGLAPEGKVVPVRLSLFAEMVKSKVWTTVTLKAVGGAEGIGVTFLEESFSAPTASPEHKFHQRAARAVLKALLPAPGTNLKGHMRTRQELLEASGYSRRPERFDHLLRLLDTEMRLVTPTDPDGMEGGGWSVEGGEWGVEETNRVKADSSSPSTLQPPPSSPHYQLTHDYLIQPVRQWLTRKQRETRRGRAELALAERGAAWSLKPETRNLPGLWEWVDIHLLTRRRSRTLSQQLMMKAANRRHLAQAGLLLVALLALGWGVSENYRLRATALVEKLKSADVANVLPVVAELEPYRHWANPLLVRLAADSSPTSRERLVAAVALARADPKQGDFLYDRLLRASPDEVLLIREALKPRRQEFTEQLWTVLKDPGRDANQRLRAACVLAAYDEDNPQWAQAVAVVSDKLVSENILLLGPWKEMLRPKGGALVDPLVTIFRSPKRAETERSLAVTLLADYAAQQVDLLAELILEADSRQYAVLLPVLRNAEDHERAVAAMRQQLVNVKTPSNLPEEKKDARAQRQGQAAVTLLHLREAAPVWDLLQFHPERQPDPRLRTYLIHRLSPLGADIATLVQRCREETDVSARRALILCLGAFAEDRWPGGLRQSLMGELLRAYSEDPDAGIHSAVDWLLRRWGRAEDLRKIDQQLATAQPSGSRHWYVNHQGHTLTVVRGPQKVWMGSPKDEVGRFDYPQEMEPQSVNIPYSFAITTKEITVAEFERFLEDTPKSQQFRRNKRFSPSKDGPIISVTWYEAAQFCRWLSEQEKLDSKEMCYPKVEEIGNGMELPRDLLARTGYRLPTEAEWEFAARAGARTSRAYGAAVELLGNYAWYGTNSDAQPHPVGQLKPNDLGMFDIYGNAWEWCQNRPMLNGPELGGFLEEEVILDKQVRVLRGGAFNEPALYARAAQRNFPFPWTRSFNVGLRVARTVR
jgi:formylglycine-generating enzyme required for sulfatase activity